MNQNPNSSALDSFARILHLCTLLEYITHVIMDTRGQVRELFMMIMEYVKWSKQELVIKQVTIANENG